MATHPVTLLPLVTDWLYSCGTNDPGSATFTVNGVNAATVPGGSGSGFLAINGQPAQDATNWGAAELMIWNRILSVQEISVVNGYLSSTYGAQR